MSKDYKLDKILSENAFKRSKLSKYFKFRKRINGMRRKGGRGDSKRSSHSNSQTKTSIISNEGIQLFLKKKFNLGNPIKSLFNFPIHAEERHPLSL